MTLPFILIVVSHVYGGTTTQMQEFYGLKSCEFAAQAVRKMGKDVSTEGARTWCVPKYTGE